MLWLEAVERGPTYLRGIEVPRNMYWVLYALVLVAVVVSVDLLFFRNQLWERLMANVGIVLVFGAFYLRFLKNL
jgi:membrane protein YdbS with pleckstrin-like domain